MAKMNRKTRNRSIATALVSVAGMFSVPVLSDPAASGALVEFGSAVFGWWTS